MKKKLSILLAAFIMLGTLSACGDRTTSSSDTSSESQSSSSESQSSSSEGESSSSESQSTSSEESTGSSTGSLQGSTADYSEAIFSARDEEINAIPMYDPLTDIQEKAYRDMTDDEIAALGEEEANDRKRYLQNLDYMFTQTFNRDDMARYAIVNPGIITLAYGVFIILPAEGKSDAVMEQVEAFVEQQKKACESYLLPQFEIAKASVIKQAPTGEILLAMCEDAPDVMDKMLAALANG